ncbi:hypothetical protein OF83DRAFT_1061466 [Amylostereum chailletii]|nr:hypothetical protein OF83DRAFT_1061466 [Amylostereum chailletii]
MAAPIWKPFYDKGVASFRKGDLESALSQFTKAIGNGGDATYIIYDSRAAVYEKQGRMKEALQDSKKVIDIAPKQWHGYYRATKLFFQANKLQSAMKMAELALERLPPGPKNDDRRNAIIGLQATVGQAQEDAVRASINHIAKLPVELLALAFLFCYQSSASSVRLSHVCGHWRAIALATPQLWQALTLARPNKAALKAKQWRTRSRGRIVELTFTRQFSEGVFAELSYNPQGQQAILHELAQLEWVYLKKFRPHSIDLSVFMHALDTIGRGDLLLRLEEFVWTGRDRDVFPELQWHPTQQSPTENPDADVGHRPPSNIRTLILHSVRCDWQALATHSGGLVTLELHDHPREANTSLIRFLLAANLALERVVITFSGSSRSSLGTDLGEPLPFTLSHLQHLHLKGILAPRTIFHHVSLPALRVLRFHALLQGSDVLRGMIEDSETSFEDLTELTLNTTTVDPRTIIQILLQAKSLERLQMSGVASSVNEVAAALSLSPDRLQDFGLPNAHSSNLNGLPIICPALRHVNFTRSPNVGASSLIEMASKRISLSTPGEASGSGEGDTVGPGDRDPSDTAVHVATLRSIVVDDCPGLETNAIPRLRRLVPEFSCRFTNIRK